MIQKRLLNFKVRALLNKHLHYLKIGCAFHGCPKCFMRWEVQPNGKTAYENYKKTQAKISKIEEAAKKCGFIVEEVWECDVKQMLSKNKKMSKFFNEVTYKTPIIPREAFFGGKNTNKL
jgi:G:T-mismatch repair DNA endonuclease (very short patch repair protein)